MTILGLPGADVWLPLLVPLIGGVLIWATGRMPNVRETMTLITAFILFGLVVSVTPGVLDGERPSADLGEVLPGLRFYFEVEPLGMIFGLVASGLWIVNSIYSIGYMRGNNEKNQTRFYIYFAIALSSAVGVAFSGNMFTLFICYEVLTISTYPLVTHSGKPEAIKGGRTYMGILLTTSIAFQLLAILWTYAITGTLDFEQGGILTGKASGIVIGILLALYMYGIGKAALMPVHRWLPAAMVAPTPVSALLHAVAVVKAGVFTVVKVIVYIFGIDLLANTPEAQWLLYMAGATVVIASIIAWNQDNLKRRLAYSTVSQLSYVILGAAILAPFSVMGAALHIAAHAFGKITLFFAAGSIYTAAHKTKVSELDGIGRRMPWTMGAFAIGALSMIGVPPAAGFISKWYLLLGAFQIKAHFAVGVIIVSTLLNAAYFLPIIYRAFFRPPNEPEMNEVHGEAPLPIVIALTTTAALTVILFFFPDIPLELAHGLVPGAQ